MMRISKKLGAKTSLPHPGIVLFAEGGHECRIGKLRLGHGGQFSQILIEPAGAEEGE